MLDLEEISEQEIAEAIKIRGKYGKAECWFCNERIADESFLYPGAALCCEGCGEPICDMCAVYGPDNFARCDSCHFTYMENHPEDFE